jgi:hypothetical protein
LLSDGQIKLARCEEEEGKKKENPNLGGTSSNE